MTEPSHTAGECIKWYSHFGKHSGSSSKDKYDPAIPFSGIYQENKKIHPCKNMYTNAHSDTTCNSQKAEKTQMSSIDERVKYGIAIQWSIICP